MRHTVKNEKLKLTKWELREKICLNDFGEKVIRQETQDIIWIGISFEQRKYYQE